MQLQYLLKAIRTRAVQTRVEGSTVYAVCLFSIISLQDTGWVSWGLGFFICNKRKSTPIPVPLRNALIYADEVGIYSGYLDACF